MSSERARKFSISKPLPQSELLNLSSPWRNNLFQPVRLGVALGSWFGDIIRSALKLFKERSSAY